MAQNLNPEIFNFLRIKPIANSVGLTQSRFSQKLRGHVIQGSQQKFTSEELQRVRQSLLTAIDCLASEIVK